MANHWAQCVLLPLSGSVLVLDRTVGDEGMVTNVPLLKTYRTEMNTGLFLLKVKCEADEPVGRVQNEVD